MAPRRIWEGDTLTQRVISVSERMLRLRAGLESLSHDKKVRLEDALEMLEARLSEIQPDDPEGLLLDELKAEIARRQISASQVSRELEISRQSLSAIFTGKSHLGPKMVTRLSEWLDKSRSDQGK